MRPRCYLLIVIDFGLGKSTFEVNRKGYIVVMKVVYPVVQHFEGCFGRSCLCNVTTDRDTVITPP